MGRNSCRILCMAAIKQESVFDEEKILIPYKIVGYEYLFYNNRKSGLRYIDEDFVKESCIMEVRKIEYFCISS